VQKQLDVVSVVKISVAPQPVIAVSDTTFFGRGYAILVIRCPWLKKNIHFHEVRSETPEEYRKARHVLEQKGYRIEATVIDGKLGVSGIFHDIPVQLCQFHQIATVRRYLASRPKLQAGKELGGRHSSGRTRNRITDHKC